MRFTVQVDKLLASQPLAFPHDAKALCRQCLRFEALELDRICPGLLGFIDEPQRVV
jgi:hypothetical protein